MFAINLEKRKRDSTDSDGTSPKRFKNGPTVCKSEKEVYELLASKKTFVLSPNIHTFSLPADCRTLEHLKRLNRALLDERNHLQHFSIMGDLVAFERPESVLKSLTNCTTLKSLKISQTILRLTDLAPLLRKKTLRTLVLSDLSVGTSMLAEIAADLIACKSLTSLDLSENIFSMFGLEKVIAQHPTLQFLNIASTLTGDNEMAIIAASLKSSEITDLDLSRTQITNENLNILSKSLRTNATLTKLNINAKYINTGMSFGDVDALKKLLEHNRTLTVLHMRGYSIGVHEADLIGTLAKSNVVKDFGVSILTQKGMDKLGVSLKTWTCLTSLDIETCQTAFIECFELAVGVRESTTLKKLSIKQGKLSTLEDLDEDFEANRKVMLYHIQQGQLKSCFQKVTKRNEAIVAFDRSLIKAFIDAKDWQGMWDFVQAHASEGFLFEDLIDRDHYSLDDYETVLQQYLKLSAPHHKELNAKKKRLDKSINDNENSIAKLEAKITAAKRVIEESNRALIEPRNQVRVLTDERKEVVDRLILDEIARERALADCAATQRLAKSFETQCKQPIDTWTLEQVILFLKDLQLHAYVDQFTDDQIKGDVLINLTTLDYQQLGLKFKEAKSLMSSLFELKHFKSLSDIPDGVLYWNNDQVVKWLEQSDFEHVTEEFRTCKITGEDLVVLDNYDLTHWLKIEAVADRTALEAAIKRLRAEIEGPNTNNTAARKVPKQFLCPITHQIMKDPVSTIDGHTYEQAAIEAWLKKKNTSPLTNETLASKQLIPNHQLKSLIADFLSEV